MNITEQLQKEESNKFESVINQEVKPTIIREIKPLSSVRLLGATWVMFFHLRPHLFKAFPGLLAFDSILGAGSYGVDFFFILSGFIIWLNYGEEMRQKLDIHAFAKFITYRIGRLWPVNVLATVISLFVLMYIHLHFNNFSAPIEPWYNVAYFLRTIFMVQEIGKPYVVLMWNQPTWTICAEFIVYFSFPIIALILSKYVKNVKFIMSLFISLFVISSMPILSHFGFFNLPYGWVYKLAGDFIAGVFLSITFLKSDSIRFERIKALKLIHYILPLLVVIILVMKINNDLIVPFLGLWVLSLAMIKSSLTKFLSTKIMLTGGYVSYSIYMLHWIFIAFLTLSLIQWPVIAKPELYSLGIVLTVFSTFFFSWLCWKFYEEPSRKFIRGLYYKFIKT